MVETNKTTSTGEVQHLKCHPDIYATNNNPSSKEPTPQAAHSKNPKMASIWKYGKYGLIARYGNNKHCKLHRTNHKK